MPQRSPSLAERLRSVLGSDSEVSPQGLRAPGRHGDDARGAEFADRLRAAVAARH